MNDYEKLAYMIGNNSSIVKVKSGDKYTGVHLIKECSLCHKVKTIQLKRHGLCKVCYDWCSRYIKKKYNKVSSDKFPEAMSEYCKPVMCKFCGLWTGILKKDLGNKRPICPKCCEIYKAAVQDVYRPKKSGYRTHTHIDRS